MQQPQRRSKHLIDPSAPRKRATPEEVARLERVQRTVLSVLVGTTIFHLAIGLVLAAVFIDDSERVAQVGLCVLGGAFGVVALASAFVIHRRQVLSPWLLLGLVPTVVGLVVVLR
ncbi:hypothetical protein FE634_11040 [Nocardioides dongxiaopingii]|uniref:hypothetical protein n=1 Tax=Nocardioides TaxID=1839 RepID=UPI0010C77004|nr:MULTISPECIES: hypothetical protein [Nocardioides]QCW52505.1 hypothetical protein FE634_11040 [Nocardioides sp. S-1144]